MHAVEMAKEGVPLVVQRQLGHVNLGITSIYLQGIHIATTRIIDTVDARRAPMIPANAGLRAMPERVLGMESATQRTDPAAGAGGPEPHFHLLAAM